MSDLILRVEVPVCSFRPHESLKYRDTFPAPPPSTVFGMLLSLIGVDGDEKRAFSGTRMALAIEERMRAARILRRVVLPKNTGEGENWIQRPEFRELLSGLKLWVVLEKGDAERSLPEEVFRGLKAPENIDRYGPLCLGESSHIVDSITIEDEVPQNVVSLHRDDFGMLQMSLWVGDDVLKNRFARFDLVDQPLDLPDDMVVLRPN